MKILIISDTHRRNENYFKILETVSPIDLLIHCGDSEGSEQLISEAADCPAEMVMGNNDFFSKLPEEIEFLVGNYKVFLVHGHNYYVSMNNEILKREARERGADIVIYGHTHKPVVEYDNGIIAINPGSLTYPRQDGKRPSYIIMEIDQDQKAHFTVFFL